MSTNVCATLVIGTNRLRISGLIQTPTVESWLIVYNENMKKRPWKEAAARYMRFVEKEFGKNSYITIGQKKEINKMIKVAEDSGGQIEFDVG
jgi:hypothetical protein